MYMYIYYQRDYLSVMVNILSALCNSAPPPLGLLPQHLHENIICSTPSPPSPHPPLPRPVNMQINRGRRDVQIDQAGVMVPTGKRSDNR